MNKRTRRGKLSIVNRKVSFSYEILDKYIAGLVLHGPEVKAIRMGNANLKDAYCYFKSNELWLKGMHISPYAPASHYNEESMRHRKLLLNQREIRKLKKGKEEKSLTIIAFRLFINEKNLIKLEIALARGKKLYDKRATIKRRDLMRKKHLLPE